MEPESIKITEAHYTTGYSIEMTFNDSSSKTINFEPYLIKSPVANINKYLDKGKFRNFFIVDGNLIWKSIEMTFPMADLYAGKI
ncbi:MAG: DUF2442 domain-containing protein [Ignavibacteria bacterium]